MNRHSAEVLSSLSQRRRELRQRMRQKRQQLTAKERALAARAIARYVEHVGWLRAGRRVAIYLAMAEEIRCEPLIERALRRHCKLYLPKILSYRQRKMWFAPMGDRYRRNRFGIPEPHGRAYVATQQLQIIFVPLVAFDAQGQRLGMGGGYYDRALHRRRHQPNSRRPRIIGIAHSVQRVAELPALATDVPLDAVVTERGITQFR